MSDFSDPEFEEKTSNNDDKNKLKDKASNNSSENINNLPQDEFTEQLLVYLALCKLSDKTAFAQLYQLTAAKLNGIAYRITRDENIANTVLEATFVEVWQQREHYQASNKDPFIYLTILVRDQAYQQLKASQVLATHEINNQSNLANLPIDDFYNAFGEFDPINSSNNKFITNLAKLEQKQSQSILLAYLYGLSNADIATYFNTPLTTIKSWVRRGMGRLS